MAIHVYMSTKRGARKADGSIELPEGAELNDRGEAGPDDDPQRFKRLMEDLGYRVELLAERSPQETTRPKRVGAPQQAPFITVAALTLEA